jgi:hypothetical protein
MVTNLRIQLSSVRASKENCKPILLLGTADCLDCSSDGATAATIMSARSIQLTARMAWPRRQRVRRPSKAWPPRVLALGARASCSRSTTMCARAGVTMFLFYSFSVLIVGRSSCDGPPRRQAHASDPRVFSRRFKERRRVHQAYKYMAAIAERVMRRWSAEETAAWPAGAQRSGADSKTRERCPANGTTRETPSSDGARCRIHACTPQIPNAVRFLLLVDRGLGVGVWCLADHIARAFAQTKYALEKVRVWPKQSNDV